MSGPISIAALEGDYTLGTPISSRLGVACYPAIGGDEKRYIIKTITVPASQTQLEALILTGACTDSAAALDYFREQAESISTETELLERLSKLEGFLPYDSCGIAPLDENRLGYQVCLVSPFRRTLERYIRGNTVTHLEMVNLGLDLCAALACARRAGYLYVDLKPANIFISDEKEYKIGDLGFVALDSLSFASLPEKYVSPYTAPEMREPLEVVNETADTYAVGMILYRLLNNGKLPAQNRDWAEPLNMPANADEEIWEIVMKACAPDPADRWENPTAMGQALVAYMQRNAINDVPVTQPVVNRQTGKLPKFTGLLPKIVPAEVDALDGKTVVFSAVNEEKTATEAPVQETAVEEAVTGKVSAEESLSAEAPAKEIPAADVAVSEVTEPSAASEDVPEEKPAPAEAPITQTVEPVIALETEVPVQESVPAEKPSAEEPPKKLDRDEGFKSLRRRKAYDPGTAKDEVITEKPVRKHHGKAILSAMITLVLLGAIIAGGLWYYQTMYVQHVDGLSVEGTRDGLTVTVSAEFDTSRLTVSCVDPYGNAQVEKLKNGTATFTDLRAGTLYNIYLNAGSNHKLDGETYTIFTTDHAANVLSLSAVAGAENGSVIVSLNVDGQEPENWLLVCSAPEEEDTSVSFSGHSVTVRGLTVDKDYLFSLSAEDGSPVSGNTTLEYSVSGLILAEDLTVSAEVPGKLDITWAPPKVPVGSWEVRCYSDNYDKTQTVVDTHAVFEDIDSSFNYTVEVTAEGMTQSARATVSANPIRITGFHDVVDNEKISLSWESTGAIPVGGWVLSYSIDGSTPSVITCSEPSAEIKLVIPDSTYRFTVEAADDTSVYNNEYSVQTEARSAYRKFRFNTGKLTILTLKTPTQDGWRADDLEQSDYSTSFRKGDSVSLVFDSEAKFDLDPTSDVTIRCVFRDAQGAVLTNLVRDTTVDWKNLWYDKNYRLAEFDLPTVPSEPGDYTLQLFFDGAPFGSVNFSITE